jgi:Ran GTPase-activating protein (RanGAP) involved in mRNA processing and transport
MTDSDVQSLVRSLTNTNLERLALDENGIGDVACQSLAELINTNERLIHLILDNNQISDRGLRLLCQAINNQKKGLRWLSLSYNYLLTDASVDCLCDMIKELQPLERLNLRGCNLSASAKEILRKTAQVKLNFNLQL